jgi:two-component system sensor kinase FixL
LNIPWYEGVVVGTVMAIRDISERRRAEIEREQLLSQLARSNTELRQLAAVATHDWRPPRLTLAAAGKGAGKRSAVMAGSAGNSERLQKSADRIASLVGDLLQYAEVASARSKARPVDLGKLARKVIAGMDQRIRQTQATVEIGFLPTIEAIPRQMHTMLHQLIDNALKFRRLDQTPKVRLRASFPKVVGRGAVKVFELHVEDNGIGFDRKVARKLFQPFRRMHSGYEGNGMGLAICRKIVERHAGRIRATSSPTRGTHLRVILPTRQRR